MKKNIITIILALGTLAAIPAVHAGEWYGGIGLGKNQWNSVEDAIQNSVNAFAESEQADCEAIGLANCRSSSSTDTELSVGLFAGYRINRYVAVEAGYVDLGKYSGSGGASGDWTDGTTITSTANIKADAQAITLSAIGYLPITPDKKGAILGKLGIARWDADASGNAGFCDGTGYCETVYEASESDSGTDPLFGLGYEHRFNNLGVRGMYEIIKDVGDEDDVKRLSLNALWYF